MSSRLIIGCNPMVREWLRYTGSMSRRNPSRNPMIQILLRLVKYALYGLQIFQAIFRVFGSSGSDVHADRKYCFMMVFWQNNRFNQNKTVQFSSVLRPLLFNLMPCPFLKLSWHRSLLLPSFSGLKIVRLKCVFWQNNLI